MKKFGILFLFTNMLIAQDTVHNFGNVQIHDETSVGFHIDFVNDGTFEQNSGLTGFYNDGTLSVSGAFSPLFYDIEIVVDDELLLYTTMNIINNSNLITGNIVTPRDQTNIFPNFMDAAFYTGENDATMVDGYAGMANKDTFTFPVGDDNRLRPLTMTSTAINALAKCAYFYENPNTPSVFGKNFRTNKKASEFLSVSEKEFWHLQGDMPTITTLTWDSFSDIPALVEFTSDLKVVGWSKTENQWVNLGNTAVDGSRANGSVTSEQFVPNEYEILTIGGNDDTLEKFKTMELGNYFMSPNGDGQNDVLVIEGIEKSPNNFLQIFNRYGVLVYSKENYTDEFNGRSNRSMVIDKDSGLDSGVYFYIITMHDLKWKHQGYLYLSR